MVISYVHYQWRTLISSASQGLKVTKEVAESQLAPVPIVDLSVVEGSDRDGEQFLRIAVVFEVKKLDPVKVVGLQRHLRKPLESLQEDRFP